jgi:O-methyltransferase involved in polyketide biosynthesis
MNDEGNGPNGSYDRISPTAWFTAYRRTFSDIPYAPEIFREMKADAAQEQAEAENSLALGMNSAGRGIFLEFRFKIINYLIRELHIHQVLELAAGYSTRGIALARRPEVTYVELDLPGVMRRKKRLLENLAVRNEIPPEPNLHLEAGNALEMENLLRAARHFKPQPIAVANEGLLMYLSFEEKARLGQNIHRLLERFGGVWITPDISPQTHFRHLKDRAGDMPHRIEQLTGIDTAKYRFADVAAMESFFQNLGFSIEQRDYRGLAADPSLTDRLGISREQVEKVLETSTAFIMRAKGS